jgi:hypothetical protein
MGQGRKMCKYKSFERRGLFAQWNNQTIVCSNPNITPEQVERVKKDLKYCSARLCPCYVSRDGKGIDR